MEYEDTFGGRHNSYASDLNYLQTQILIQTKIEIFTTCLDFEYQSMNICSYKHNVKYFTRKLVL